MHAPSLVTRSLATTIKAGLVVSWGLDHKNNVQLSECYYMHTASKPFTHSQLKLLTTYIYSLQAPDMCDHLDFSKG